MALNDQARALLDLLDARGDKPVPDSTVAEVRAANWDWVEFMGDAEEVAQVEDKYIPGPTAELHVRIYTPEGAGPFPCMVFFHGGGWTVGNIELADRPTRSLVNATGCVVVLVNYQKAPEHRFPTALEDCSATVQWVVQSADVLKIDPDQVGVGGDSAGGNLAAAVCLMARDTAGFTPAFQLLIYPAMDPVMDMPSAQDNAEGYGLTTAAMRWFWDQYVPVLADRDNPLASPLRAPDLHGLPPAILVTVDYDPLRDEGEQYADLLEAAGVTVIRHRYPGTIHGFLWMADALSHDFGRLMDDLGSDIPALLQLSARKSVSSQQSS
jgi:acetyl esterase